MILERYARGKENSLVEEYIKDGPTALWLKIGLSEDEWRVVFDYLVFEHNLLYKTVAYSGEFFLGQYIKHGMSHVREILDVTNTKYDVIFEVIVDFLAISKEGLYFHVLEHRDRYMIALRARGGDFVRKVLGIWKEKYDEAWAKILDVLLNACCDAIFSKRTFENGLESFVRLMNVMREHSRICKY